MLGLIEKLFESCLFKYILCCVACCEVMGVESLGLGLLMIYERQHLIICCDLLIKGASTVLHGNGGNA